MKYYRYHIVDSNEVRVESNLPSRDSAETYKRFLEERDGYGVDELSIVEEHRPQAQGLGRDPDLH